MPRLAELLLIRHAQSTWNAEGRWQGQGDPPLSALGRRQAAEAAERLAAERLAALVASDLRRAAETAAILGERLGLPVHPDPRLRELDVGVWSGLPHDEIGRRWPQELARFRSGDPDARPGGGESRNLLRARVGPALAEWAAAHPGGRVGVVTHRGVIHVMVPGARPHNLDVVRWTLPEPGTGADASPGPPR